MLKAGSFADMHTHCEYSHDSVCKMEDMCLAQIEKGARFFAVTDHFDTGYHMRYDIFTPIKESNEMVAKLNQKYGDKIELLAGIEIGEGFWYLEEYKKVMKLCDYDVILGSVHLVKYRELTGSCSNMDFMKLDMETIEEYVDAYFDDMITMIDTIDFDVLTHLTMPLKYINGKYHRGIELTRYEQKIDFILDKIIQKEIALEVNTSTYELLGGFMPFENILKRYYKKGGTLITLGSDAHGSAQASQYFEQAIEAIKEIGFQNIYYYKKRKPYALRV